MKLLDINILLYAYVPEYPEHERAKAWLENALSARERVLLPLVTILGFIRIGTDARVFSKPFDPSVALSIVESWISRPNVRIVEPSVDHWTLLRDVTLAGQARGATITDAHLATLAMEYGAVLYTTDRGFTRFPGLRTKNPLAGKVDGPP